MVLQDFSELACYRDLPFLPTFGREAIVPLSGHANGPQPEVDVGPEQIHDFLFTEAGHQKSREHRAFSRVADVEELRKISLPIAYSERCRSAFRGDGDRDSELMPITIPR